MFAITLGNLFWNAETKSFGPVPTRYETRDEAIEAAQEDARLAPDAPWSVVAA
jgi:hypothetical protein